MATDLERLIVSLEASTVKYERALQRAMGQTNTVARRIENRFARMGSGVTAGFGRLGGALAAGLSAQKFQQLLDASTRIENSLRVAGLAGKELTEVYDGLFASAQRNAAPIETLAQLYGKVALVQNELGVSSEELIGFTDNISKALRVSGADAQSASGALLQLSQALGGGVVRAEEFNSILEGAPAIAQAAAAGLKEAGGSVAELRKLVIDGKVSSEAFFRAIEAGSVILDEKLAGSTFTIGQAFTQLNNAAIDAVKKFDEAFDVSDQLAGALVDAGSALNDFTDFLISNKAQLDSWLGSVGGAIGELQKLANGFAQFTGLENFGVDFATKINGLGIPGFDARFPRGGQIITGTFELLGATPQDEELAAALLGNGNTSASGELPVGLHGPTRRRRVRPVSLDDFKPPATSTGGGGRSPGDRFADSLQNIEDRTAALDLETAAIGRSTYEKERSLTVEKLLNEARDAGLRITPEVRASIDQVADAYARASQYAEDMANKQEFLKDQMSDFADLGKSALSGFISDLREGKSAAEAFANVLDNIASKLIDMAINNLFGGLFGGGGAGLFGRGFASGTANTGGSRGQPRGIVHGQEAVIPLLGNGKVPVDLRLPTMAGPAPVGGVTRIELLVTEGAMFDARVVQAAAPVAVEVSKRALGEYDRGLTSRLQEKDLRGL